MSTWSGHPRIRGGSEMVRMMLLNSMAMGISFTWGVEMTYCTPYLLSLGLTKGQTSFVWIAGPLSGLIVQPIIGAVADGSRSRWGRRRPVIVAGSFLVALSMLTIGFTKDIVSCFVTEQSAIAKLTLTLAVLALYVADFSINAVMSCARSLVVDTLPIQKQQAGAAWAGRMGSLGHMIGYAMGSVDLVQYFGTTLGDTQFKQLTMISAISLVVSAGLICWAVSERVLVSVHDQGRCHNGRFQLVAQIWSTLLALPPRIRAICLTVFWTWIGFYPFLVYSSTWVGETYFRYDVPDDVRNSSDALGEMGRIGSSAMTVYSTVGFVSAWVLPLLVRSPDDRFTRRPLARTDTCIDTLDALKPDLLTAWVTSHVMFACAMFMTPLATSFRFATVIVALCGLPSAVGGWAATTFLGVEVNKLSGPNHLAPDAGTYQRISQSDSIELLDHPQLPALPETEKQSSGQLSGIYFGIMNIYVCIPQFISTFISAIIFSVMDPGKSPELAADPNEIEHHPKTQGPNAIAVSMVIGGLSSLMAAWATRRLAKLL